LQGLPIAGEVLLLQIANFFEKPDYLLVGHKSPDL
jgi:hypothetical protein